MVLATDDGRRFRFEGHKVLHDRFGLDLWSDTTTLYVTIGDEVGTPLVGGVMRIVPADFARLSTLHVTGVDRLGERVRWKARFGARFFRSLTNVYASLDDVVAFPEAPPRRPLTGAGRRKLRLPSPEPSWCDGAGRWHEGDWDEAADPDRTGWLRLVRYEGGRRGPVLLAAGFGMSATSFLVDTVDTNLTEHLVPRATTSGCSTTASTDLPSARTASPSTTSPAPTGPRRSPRSGGSPAPGASRRWVTAWARPRCSWRSPTGSTTCGPPCACSSRSTRSPRTSTRSRPRSRSTRCSPGSVCTR